MSVGQKEFSVVGKSVPRVDAYDKVRGKARFTDDMVLKDMAYGKIKKSTIAHGIIKKIDFKRALELPGVLTVITGEESPQPFSVNILLPTETPLAVDKVRYAGEGVAAVVALDEDTAEEALALINVEYEPLPVEVDARESRKRTENLIHDFADNNTNHHAQQDFGDVDNAFDNSHVVVENSFYSSYVNKGFLEPQSAIGDFNPGSQKLTLYTCNQMPHYLQRTVSHALDIPMEKIRIVVPFVGGGFGGKSEATPASLLAGILSRKLGRPVKITYDRKEVFFQNKGRHPCHMNMKMGFDQGGNITGVDFDVVMDGGAHSGWGFVVLWFIAALTHLPYKIPNVRFRGQRVYTNKPTPGAQRCLGGVQTRMCVESVLDQGAEKLGMSPLNVRLKNAVETGYQTKTAISVAHSEFKKCLETVAARSGYQEKHGKLPFGKGIGIAGGHYSSGGAFLLYKSSRPHSAANIRIDTESGVTVFVGATDIGQGSSTVLTQMAAEVLGVNYCDVHLVCQDTMLAPMDNGTMDSRVTYGAGHAVKNAAVDAKNKLLKVAAIELGLSSEQLDCREGKIYSVYNPKKAMSFTEAVSKYQDSIGTLFGTGDYTPPQPVGNYPGKLIGPSPAFGFTAQVAEVEVDLETGKIDIVKYYEAGDCGKAINPMSVEGQVQGGISMGLGQALYEEMVIDKDGMMLNPNFHDYKIPTSMDMPHIESDIVESYDPTSAFGNKEVGEGPAGAVIPAIFNALYDAIGIRFTEVPITPEKVLKALGKI